MTNKNNKKEQTTEQKVASVIIFSIMFLLIGMCMLPESPQQQSTNPNDIIPIDEAFAQVLCKMEFKSRAVYKFKGSFNYDTRKMIDIDNEEIYNVYIKDMQFQNAYGVYEKASGYCIIPTKGKRKLIENYNNSLIKRIELY